MKKNALSLITATILAAGVISLPAHAEPAAADTQAPTAMKMSPKAMSRHHARHHHCSCRTGDSNGNMMGGMGMRQGMGGMGMSRHDNRGMGHGMMDHGAGMGMMGGMHHPMAMHHLNALKLSDEQRAKVNKLNDELRKKHWAGMGAIMDESAKLRDLYAAEKRDPAAIGQIYQRIFEQKRQMIESSIDTQNHIDEILTPEQLAQLKQMKHRGQGCNCPAEMRPSDAK
jgi:Spy/CpxP family protein refolding chaperone